MNWIECDDGDGLCCPGELSRLPIFPPSTNTGGSHLFFSWEGKGVVEIVAQETKVSLLKTDLL